MDEILHTNQISCDLQVTNQLELPHQLISWLQYCRHAFFVCFSNAACNRLAAVAASSMHCHSFNFAGLAFILCRTTLVVLVWCGVEMCSIQQVLAFNGSQQGEGIFWLVEFASHLKCWRNFQCFLLYWYQETWHIKIHIPILASQAYKKTLLVDSYIWTNL